MAQRYQNIKLLSTETGRRYRTNTLYPDIPESDQDTYFIATSGDRYDILALQYYGDIDLWWIIASANNATIDNLVIQPGKQIRIPSNKQQVLDLFEQLNS